MPAEPNLSTRFRIGYVVAGLLLMAWGFFWTQKGWWHYLAPVLGGIVLVEGLIGYCVLCAAFGIGVRRN
ncbi:MAG: DUF2892 domain-containing protein [Firmicutes bacterium]|jgi:hypothetical protein|nr:DUF2892 domain-containing protein [Bacillota bacterium]